MVVSMQSKGTRLVMLWLMLFLLVSCQRQESGPNFASYLSGAQPTTSPALSGAPGPEQVIRQVGEEVYYTLDTLVPPRGFRPVGMLDADHGYIISESETQTLWLYDYVRAEHQPVIDCSQSGGGIFLSEEIAFSERWLIWQEVEEVIGDAIPYKECSLWARDRRVEGGQAADILIVKDSIAMIHGYFLPFDNLSLDGDRLVYRYVDFSKGSCMSAVRLVDLRTLEERTLATANESSNRRINRCSIADSLVVWDVQIGYAINISGMPPQTRARYHLYTYQLDPEKLGPKEDALQQITMNRNFSAPFAYRGKFAAVITYPLTAYDYSLRSDIVFIDTTSEENSLSYLTTGNLTTATDYEVYLKESYFPLRYDGGLYGKRVFWRYQPFIGKKILTWGSSLPEHHVVLDMETYNFLALPVYFSDAYEGMVISQKIDPIYTLYASGDVVITGYTVEEIPWWPNLERIRVTPIPGLDADYLLFEHIENLEPPYILRIE